jgi:hypothetical protein
MRVRPPRAGRRGIDEEEVGEQLEQEGLELRSYTGFHPRPARTTAPVAS